MQEFQSSATMDVTVIAVNDELRERERTKRPSVRFLLSHPAHWLALGFGTGLSRIAPGTAGTLFAWLTYDLLSAWLSHTTWAWVIGVSLLLGWRACSVTSRHMQIPDHCSLVWDEVVAFWLVLWLVMPASLVTQAAAFALFRFFDAVKPGPVGWADKLFHRVDPLKDRHAWTKAGFGIMFDDLVAAGCTLLVLALWRFF